MVKPPFSDEECPLWRRNVLALDETAPGAAKLARWAEAWIRKAANNAPPKGGSKWLALYGPAGVGKSHAMKRARRYLSSMAIDLWALVPEWRGPRVPATCDATWSDVCALDREDWQDWLQDVKRAAWVFLDDVGSEADRYRSGEHVERLRVVLDACESKWLLMSTNVEKTRWRAIYDARTADRMNKAATLDLSGAESYRGRKQPLPA